MYQKRLPSQEVEELSQALMDRAALRDVKRAAAYYKFIRYSYRAGGAVPSEDRLSKFMCFNNNKAKFMPNLINLQIFQLFAPASNRLPTCTIYWVKHNPLKFTASLPTR